MRILARSLCAALLGATLAGITFRFLFAEVDPGPNMPDDPTISRLAGAFVITCAVLAGAIEAALLRRRENAKERLP